MKMDSFLRTPPLILLMMFMLFAAPASAQTEAAPLPQAASDTAQRMSDEEVTIMRDEYAGKYNISTLENLSKLYWRLGAFDFEDDEAVGNYLKINDCKIYAEYLNDDLEWQEIIKVMKDHLKKNSSNFPLNYQFILKLHLGRYDTEKGGFPIVDKTGFKDSKRISVGSIDKNRFICHDSQPIKDYPLSLIVILDEGFTLDTLKVDEHVAQAYILRKKAEYSVLSEEERLRAYERTAYLRFRMTFSQYHGNMRDEKGDTTALIYGHIDGYEIFEDSDQKRMMLSVENAAPATQQASDTTVSPPTEDSDTGDAIQMHLPGTTSP